MQRADPPWQRCSRTRLNSTSASFQSLGAAMAVIRTPSGPPEHRMVGRAFVEGFTAQAGVTFTDLRIQRIRRPIRAVPTPCESPPRCPAGGESVRACSAPPRPISAHLGEDNLLLDPTATVRPISGMSTRWSCPATSRPFRSRLTWWLGMLVHSVALRATESTRRSRRLRPSRDASSRSATPGRCERLSRRASPSPAAHGHHSPHVSDADLAIHSAGTVSATVTAALLPSKVALLLNDGMTAVTGETRARRLRAMPCITHAFPPRGPSS